VRIDCTTANAGGTKKDEENLGFFKYDLHGTPTSDELYKSVQFFGKSDPKMGLSHYQTSRYTALILLVPPCYLMRSEKRRLY